MDDNLFILVFEAEITDIAQIKATAGRSFAVVGLGANVLSQKSFSQEALSARLTLQPGHNIPAEIGIF